MMNFERHKKPGDALEVGVWAYLPIVKLVKQREEDYIGGGYEWRALSKEETIGRLEKIIDFFGNNKNLLIEMSREELDIEFYLKNPQIMYDYPNNSTNPHDLPKLQGMEIIYEGKIYKLPMIWLNESNEGY